MTTARFFIDHGVIHDRETGKHVRGTPDDGCEDGITACCALLNALAARRPEEAIVAEIHARIGARESHGVLGDVACILEWIDAAKEADAIDWEARWERLRGWLSTADVDGPIMNLVLVEMARIEREKA